jgi:Zn-dependent M28 family amino/carboxypeptidase
MELAKIFAEAKKQDMVREQHSFMAFYGEESGLLGSDFMQNIRHFHYKIP